MLFMDKNLTNHSRFKKKKKKKKCVNLESVDGTQFIDVIMHQH